MKKALYFLCISALIFTTGCKKDSDNNDPTPIEPAPVDANGNITFGNDIDGACYSLITRYYDDNAGPGYDDAHSAVAWFGKTTAFKDAGTVSVNDLDLTNFGGLNYYTYIGFDELFPGNTANWEIGGNSANGITGFTYSDDAAFSSGGNFTLPAKINIATDLTVSFTPLNNVYAVAYSIAGNKGQKNKAVLGSASSVTFTAAELNEVAYSGDAIAVGVMSIVATPKTIDGKKYYFVKEFQKARETETQ